MAYRPQDPNICIAGDTGRHYVEEGGGDMNSSDGFIGFVVDAIQKIAYCDRESRPSDVAARVLDFLRSWGEDPELVDVVRALHVVRVGQRPTGDEAEHLRRYARRHGRADSMGMPSAILAEGVIEDASDIAFRTLSWGFMIDLDCRTLQVFSGSLDRASASWWLGQLPDHAELLAALTLPVTCAPA
jgi:hypothetical protein